jgi:mRNA-degrading endonuclease RelE of RelBE toxin-antitoxin system
VKSHINDSFRRLFASLPAEIQQQAREAYKLFRSNPRHPGLHFKHVHGSDRLVSVRVGRSYRAVGTLSDSDEIVWFWIGPHEQYEKILYSM